MLSRVILESVLSLTSHNGSVEKLLDARVEEGRNSVYGIARKLQKTVLAVMSQTRAEKLYAKILL